MAANQTSTRTRGKRVAGFIGLLVLVPGIAAASLTAGYSTASAAPVAINPTLASLAAPVHVKTACPSNMAHVGSSCVDKYEASLVERTPEGEKAFSPYEAPNGHDVRAVSRRGVVPQAHISMVEAKRACAASGKRLCKAAEWKTACKGPEPKKFGYANERTPGTCNDNGKSPVGTFFPAAVAQGNAWTWDKMNDERLNQMAGGLAETGSHEGCTNGYGVYDMVGNLHEWVLDSAGTFQGGYYLDVTQNGDGCGYRTDAHEAWYHDYSTGFRCCADPAQ